MARLSEVSEPLNCLLYGDGGTGKTTAALGMARLGPVLVINAEAGVKARPLAAMGVPIEQVEVWPDPGQPITFQTLEALWLRLRESLMGDPDAYAGVVVDSATELVGVLLEEVRKESVAKAKLISRPRDEWLIERSDYGTMTDQVRIIMRRLRDLPCHLAVTALERRDQDDDGAVRYGPAVTPALQLALFGWLDVVGWCSTAAVAGEREYRGRFAPHGKYNAKDRYNAIPEWLVDPWFDRLFGYVSGSLTEDKDERLQAARRRAQAASRDGAGGKQRKEVVR